MPLTPRHTDIPDRDSEELRRSQARLSGLIASAMDAIISVNEAHDIVVFNAAAERIFGCSAQEAIGTQIHSFLPERFRAAHVQHIRAFAATGVTTRSMGALRPLTALRRDGTEFPIEATISQVDVAGQKLFTVILRDVSARKTAEAERDQLLDAAREQAAILEHQAKTLADANLSLARFAEEAEAANMAKSEFLAVMSHELRTPLNAIAGYVELLKLGIRGPLNPTQVADLGRIERSQKHLLGLINQVLSFARLETGRLEFDIETLPVDELLEVEGLVEPLVRAKSLRYEYEAPDRSLRARGDRDKVSQIVLNLLSNAVKFTPEGGCITIRAEQVDNAVLIHVRDTGRGIPAENMKSIFEPFVQVDRRLTRDAEGIGLGLAISRDLARRMDGDLTAQSEEGVGSVFTLRLPAANDSGNFSAAPAST